MRRDEPFTIQPSPSPSLLREWSVVMRASINHCRMSMQSDKNHMHVYIANFRFIRRAHAPHAFARIYLLCASALAFCLCRCWTANIEQHDVIVFASKCGYTPHPHHVRASVCAVCVRHSANVIIVIGSDRIMNVSYACRFSYRKSILSHIILSGDLCHVAAPATPTSNNQQTEPHISLYSRHSHWMGVHYYYYSVRTLIHVFGE